MLHPAYSTRRDQWRQCLGCSICLPGVGGVGGGGGALLDFCKVANQA